jgi:cobalt-precorrin 5A hydrolase
MERGDMRVAGLGFRQGVEVAALREALDAAGGHHGLAALATISDKAAAGALVSLASELGLPIRTVPADRLTGVETVTRSERIEASFGAGSLAEAVALIAAGRNARLMGRRAVSQDRTATAAIAEGDGP